MLNEKICVPQIITQLHKFMKRIKEIFNAQTPIVKSKISKIIKKIQFCLI